MTKLSANQVMVKANRNFTLTTTLGHVIAFKKDVETPIPRMVLAQAQAYGCVVADSEDTSDEPKLPVEPNDPAVRAADIKKAVEGVRERNAREDFTAAGKPKVNVISRLVGYSVTSQELDPVLQAIYDAEAEAKLGAE